MKTVASLDVRAHTEYKDHFTKPKEPPTLRRIEEGVTLIETILQKEILCRHDVEKINRLYHDVDLLEKKIDKIPDRNSQTTLQKIVSKVGKIVQETNLTAQNLIFLYHFQEFSDQELPIAQAFKKKFSKFKKSPEAIREIAIHLPYCSSKTQFEEAITALIGSQAIDSEISKILDKKKKKIQDRKDLQQAINIKKDALAKNRSNHSTQYPAHLEELLNKGYIHLYDHLLAMKNPSTRKEREEKIEKLTFSELSHIILETREAIIEKVSSAIPHTPHQLVFLLGGTGSGKSTIFCFLRGDIMILKNDYTYASTNDQSNLISHEGAISCTFLPNTEIVNNFIIVDFPGFSDTNGSLISLGMECALKALITKYHPKILVLQSITSTEEKYVAAATLGKQLKRLMDNTEACVLGVTKYSRDPNFRDIKAMEEKQKESQSSPTKEEIVLEAEIRIYNRKQKESKTTEKKQEYRNKIEKKEKELAKLRQAREQQIPGRLPETKEKKERRQALESIEKQLLQQIGLKSFIPFSDLEDLKKRDACLDRILQSKQVISRSPKQSLNADHERLLNQRFEKNLISVIESLELDDIDVDAFEQSILESSLIKTLLSSSYPEIGEFLHLPEMDLKIVDGFSKKVVGECIDKVIRNVVKTIDMHLIGQFLKEFGHRANPGKRAALEAKQKKLQEYILFLLGIEATEQQIDEKWEHIQKKLAATINSVEEEFKLPTLAKIAFVLATPLPLTLSISTPLPLILIATSYQMIGRSLVMGVPLWIYTVRKQLEKNHAIKEKVDPYLDEYCNALDRAHNTLIKLKRIEQIIQKKERSNLKTLPKL